MQEDNHLELPNNIDECHNLIKELSKKINELTHRLQLLTKQKYGKKAEDLNVEQLKIVFEELKNEYPELDLTQFEEQKIDEVTKVSKTSGGGRRITQSNNKIETKVITHELSDDSLICPDCQIPRVECGSVTTSELDYIPAKLIILEHKQIKYACKKCKASVLLAPKPEMPAIEKGAPSFSLLSNIITSKYADHLPLYRQEQIFERLGVSIPRSSMCRWLGVIADKLEPVYNAIKQNILESNVVQADETPLKYLQEKKAGKANYGYIWTYIGDKNHNYVAYAFHTDRSGINPDKFLSTYIGYLQTDGYTGYNRVNSKDGMKSLACWAHARRKFTEALNNNKVHASYALLEIGKLYAIERKIKDLDEDEKLKIRKLEAIPILNSFKEWLIKMKIKYSTNEPFDKAISYALKYFDKLTVYTEQGYLSIDNNMAERNIRPIAIGRKNWMFLGNEGAGKTFAILSSLVNSCKMNDINVYEYIKDAIEKLTINPKVNISELLPLNWQKN